MQNMNTLQHWLLSVYLGIKWPYFDKLWKFEYINSINKFIQQYNDAVSVDTSVRSVCTYYVSSIICYGVVNQQSTQPTCLQPRRCKWTFYQEEHTYVPVPVPVPVLYLYLYLYMYIYMYMYM